MEHKKKGLLIITQAVDETDTNLSFFLYWINQFSNHFDSVHVATWKEGPHSQLSERVTVHLMPKGKVKRFFALLLLSWKIRHDIQAVFVHMLAPVAAVMGWLWRLQGKYLVLWYTHGSVPLSLRVANLWVNKIVSATSESMRLKTKKKIVTGHGIETNRFRPNSSSENRRPELITVGRITPRKKLEELLDLVDLIRQKETGLRFKLLIIGDAYLDTDREYQDQIDQQIKSRKLSDFVLLAGPKLGDELFDAYRQSALFVTASRTGSLDKAVLESLSSGTPVLAKSGVFSGFSGVHIAGDSWNDASIDFAIQKLKQPRTDYEVREDLEQKASLPALIGRLTKILLA